MADDDRTPESCAEATSAKEERRKIPESWSSRNEIYRPDKPTPTRYRAATEEERRERKLAGKRATAKRWREKNPELAKARARVQYETHREKAKARTKAWRIANPERKRENAKAWEKANREQINERYREQRRRRYAERQATDPAFRIRKNLTSTVRQAFRLQGTDKRNSTIELIGCSIEELKAHLEAQFQPGMTWDNYGYRGWHIDHRRPCASFDLTDSEQQKVCFHWSNLQPLWREDNQKKTNRLDWEPK